MMDLDTLLEEAREAEPVDDGFTERVMMGVRAEASTAWRHRRFFTRPMALAAAALLVTGGALAARTVSAPEPTELAEAPAQEAELVTRPAAADAASSPDASVGPAPVEAGEDPEPNGARRHGDYEWGYEGPHTSYVLHVDTGLRLQTETYTNDFALGRPQEVTLTLSNTGEEPVAVTARHRCALLVTAYRSQEREDGRSILEPARDGRHSQGRCVADEARSPEDPSERFVLGPGEERVVDTTLVLEQQGSWAVVGMCRCTFGPLREEPEETDRPDDTLRLPDLSLSAPLDVIPEVPSRLSDPQRRGESLVTPPVHVEVSG